MHYSRMTSFPVHSIFGLAYASAFTSSHTCTWSLWRIQCENTQFEPPQIYPTYMIPGINGDITHVYSVPDFWMGGVDKRIFGPSADTPPKKKLPTEVQCMSEKYNPKDGVHSMILKTHLQNLAKCINESNSITIY